MRHNQKMRVNKIMDRYGIALIIGLLIITNVNCGPIISKQKFVIRKTTGENNWSGDNSQTYYYCDDFKIEIHFSEIYTSGLWFACCLLPISQGVDNKNYLELFLTIKDNKTDLPTKNFYKLEKETLKILADKKIYLPSEYRESETSTYMGASQKRVEYNYYVYKFDIREFKKDIITVIFSKNFNNIINCSIPNLDIQIKDKISFGAAIPGHADEIFDIKY